MKLLIIFILFFCCFSSAFEPRYGRENIKEYLSKKDAVVLAVKVGGAIGINEYQKLTSSFLGDESLEKWKGLDNKNQLDRFIVIKSYKSDEVISSNLLVKQLSEGYDATFLKEIYILFLEKNRNLYLEPDIGKTFTYTICDVVHIGNNLPDNKKQKIFNLNVDELIDMVVTENIIGC